mgnify:CR=1 FL=1
MGNDLVSWRTTVGLFYCKSRTTWKRCARHCDTSSTIYSILLDLYLDCKLKLICGSFIFLCSSVNVHFFKLLIIILLLSGDVESNGGVIYVKTTVHSKRRHDIESLAVQCIWLEISYKSPSFLLCTVYRPPNSPALLLG